METLTWNEEVQQKDIEAVVDEASAWEMVGTNKRKKKLDQELLIRGFRAYRTHYDECLLNWKANRLDSAQLARQTIVSANKIKPGTSCQWTSKLREELPKLIAGVCCYLTICKSGDSFRRLAEDNQSNLTNSSSENSTCQANGAELGDNQLVTHRHAGSHGGARGIENGSTFNLDSMLLTPHCAQVLTLLQMLGYTSNNGSLERQLMQIRTGEGKSLILGVGSIILALLGFRVRCVCYSEYLSNRDYKLFAELFTGFGVAPLVKYSTITQYSEDLTKRKGNIRELTLAMIRGEFSTSATYTSDAKSPTPQDGPISPPYDGSLKTLASQQEPEPSKGAAVEIAGTSRQDLNDAHTLSNLSDPDQLPEILLVDEVDVFFGEDFYGQSHAQVAEVNTPEAVGLIKIVWELYYGGIHDYHRLLSMVQKTQEYDKLLHSLSLFKVVIEREVEAMCADVLCFDEPMPHYDRGLDRLGYHVMDGIDYYTVVYRYRTAFA